MQLRWFGWSAMPFACCVVGAFIASKAGEIEQAGAVPFGTAPALPTVR